MRSEMHYKSISSVCCLTSRSRQIHVSCRHIEFQVLQRLHQRFGALRIEFSLHPRIAMDQCRSFFEFFSRPACRQTGWS